MTESIKVPGLKGQRIEEVRRMTDEECVEGGVGHWTDSHQPNPVCIITEAGNTVYPSQDPEGNGPGALFGTSPDGEGYYVGD